MKQKSIHTALLTLLVGLCSACEQEIAPVSTSGSHALQVCSVELPELSSTRALGATQLNEIGVYVTNHDNTPLSDKAQSIYKFQSGTWSSDTPPDITVADAATSNLLYAFSPASAVVTNDGGGLHTIPASIVADDFTASRQVDYLYAAPAEAWASSRSVTFTMNHALAKVSFRVRKSDAVQEVVALKSIELLSSTSRLQSGSNATMNLQNGTLNGLASTSSLILSGSVTLSNVQNQPNVSALVAPMSARETRLSFRLTVEVTENDGSSTKRTFETATVKEVQWKAGYHYIYVITVDKMGGSLTNVLIDAWKNDANQNTGIGI